MFAMALGAAQPAQAAADSSFVYVMTNSTGSNAVIAFKRADDGSLSMAGTYMTGGKGISGDVDDQHSLRVAGNWVFAANPGSNDITVFKKDGKGLKKMGQYPSGGMNPVSIAVSGNKLAVANQAVKSGTPNISTFNIGMDGSLKPTGKESVSFTAGAGPADVDFSPNGKMLAVSYGYQAAETSMVATYAVDDAGMLSKASEAPAFGPVGLSWNPNGSRIYVSTFRNASILTFGVGEDGKLTALQTLKDTETAACWTTVNAAGDRLYAANFVSNSVSTYSLDNSGDAKFVSAAKRPNVSGNDTKDMALSADGKFLYVLGSTSKRIDTFKVGMDGTLTFMSSTKSMMGDHNWKGLAIH
jgi:6-phosphogluconolactonase (cycloisomerase 2 family)